MGLIENKKSNKIFLSVIDGKITQKVKKEDDGALSRINSKDEEVFEKRFGGVDGFIYAIDVNETDKFGNQLIIDVADKGELYQIQVPLNSSYAYDFLCRAEGITFDKQVILNTYKIPREDDKTKYNQLFVITQEGIKVAKRYTKDFPNGLPAATQEKEGTKTVWNFTAVTNFYYKIAKELSAKLKTREKEILMLSE